MIDPPTRQRTLWVVGSLNEDVIIQIPTALCTGATIVASGSITAAGGKGLNQAVAARRRGAKTILVGSVGDDAAGARLLADARMNGVAMRIEVVAGSKSGRAHVFVTPDATSTIVVEAEANNWTTGAIEEVAADDVVLVQLEIPIESARRALSSGRAVGATTILSASPVLAESKELFALCDFVVLNGDEAIELSGAGHSTPPEIAAATLAGSDRCGVVVTLGAGGATLIQGTHIRHFDAEFSAMTIDTTGAGDAFTGSFAASFALGNSVEEAIHSGLRSGAETVSFMGAHPFDVT